MSKYCSMSLSLRRDRNEKRQVTQDTKSDREPSNHRRWFVGAQGLGLKERLSEVRGRECGTLKNRQLPR